MNLLFTAIMAVIFIGVNAQSPDSLRRKQVLDSRNIVCTDQPLLSYKHMAIKVNPSVTAISG